MDIHQLRSWIFELYEPLENERQYIVFDSARGNLLIDVPPFSARAERLIAGTGRAGLLVVTNRRRASLAQKYRETLGVRIAAHADDASAIGADPDVILSDDEAVRPDARAIRFRSGSEGATVLLIRKAGGVLVVGDLDLGSKPARELDKLEFSAVLSSERAPMWNAGKDTLLLIQQQLPKPRKQFSILIPPPWDRAYVGRLEDKMVHNEKIVPKEATSAREAAMGPATLVVSQEARELIGRAKRPAPATATGGGNGAGAPPASKQTKRPKPFAEDWDAPGTDRPATTIANAPANIVTRDPEARMTNAPGKHQPQPLGERFKRHAIEDL